MNLTHMTYTRVSAGRSIPELAIQPHAEVELFLSAHIFALLESAQDDRVPPGTILSTESRAALEQVRAPDIEEFLSTAQSLATDLVAEMDGRSRDGLLVFIGFRHDAVPSLAILKLDVTAENAAVLRRIESGEETLAAATNVLDAPGRLQKGILYPDPRSTSEIVVSDRLRNEAQYFLKAFGIRIQSKPNEAAPALLNSIAENLNPEIATLAADALPCVEDGNVQEVISSLTERVPNLRSADLTSVMSDLVGRRAPVGRIHTTTPLKEIVTADGIKITGSVEAMRQVEIGPDPELGWRITVRTREQPTRQYRN